ncbi:unnamed protein product [Boreogadus saida]
MRWFTGLISFNDANLYFGVQRVLNVVFNRRKCHFMFSLKGISFISAKHGKGKCLCTSVCVCVLHNMHKCVCVLHNMHKCVCVCVCSTQHAQVCVCVCVFYTSQNVNN